MEMRKEMPDEVKNQIIDGKKRVITEKIPDKYLKEIEELKQKKGKAVQEFLQSSVKVVNAQQQQKDILEKVKDADKQIGDMINYTFKKLKLHRRKDRRWSIKGTDFVGVYNPPRPKPMPPPKQENK